MKNCACIALILTAGICTASDGEGRFFSSEELRPIYNTQVDRLRAAGYVELFGGDDLFNRALDCDTWSDSEGRRVVNEYPESLRSKLRKMTQVWVDDGNIPLLIVIPENYAPLRWQATRVTIDGVKSDAPQFELSRIADITDGSAPQHPYIIFNVNSGTDTWRISGQSVEGDIKRAQRRGLTFVEGIALLIQYPDAIKCMRGIDENYREHFAFGRCVFLRTCIDGACPCDRSAEEFATFCVRKHTESGFARGYFTKEIRRDMTPNYSRFTFPSCDATTEAR